ncbi:MAG: thioredoxin domain-containing protein [Syntrophaceae bacterium]|nr:thioredoxin domain-containing protein [Syntrophaceae bacterium]
MSSLRKNNRLSREKSPYLLQHADNPVDWYPWGEEAFARAKAENKPVFLSIGYSTCHWCHVMAHESFEDEKIAALLNNTFVCVKVDREERPDIDKVYMAACQMLTGQGGWPLTIVMTPEKEPFFAATYIAKKSRSDSIGLEDLIPRIAAAWQGNAERFRQSAADIIDSLKHIWHASSEGKLPRDVRDHAFASLVAQFDELFGGFGSAPKFPMPHQLLFLLRHGNRTGEPRVIRMVEKTLLGMAAGGIHDHLGGGFHRYSTDPRWLVPHFEKMLYDQALLSLAYTEAFQVTGNVFFRDIAEKIFAYVLRDMTSPHGGFYSAEDADSEGEEGKFYLWRQRELEEMLLPEEVKLITYYYAVEPQGNYTDELKGGYTGNNILHRQHSLTDLAAKLKMTEADLEKKAMAVTSELFRHREKRIRPHRDDKITTDWNGLMIAALARGGRVYGSGIYMDAANAAARFILENLRTEDGRLIHRWRDGEAAKPASLDDYAFFIWGLIELYEATFDPRWLEAALTLNEELARYYWDEEGGAYYFTPSDGEKLLLRQKEFYDGAIPSGNAVACLNLIRLGKMTGRHDLEEQADLLLRSVAGAIRQMPGGCAQFMIALDFLEGPSYEVVIAGVPGRDDTLAMLEAVNRHYLPRAAVLFQPSGNVDPLLVQLAPYVKGMDMIDGKATAYVCVNQACHTPTTDPMEMIFHLSTPAAK